MKFHFFPSTNTRLETHQHEDDGEEETLGSEVHVGVKTEGIRVLGQGAVGRLAKHDPLFGYAAHEGNLVGEDDIEIGAVGESGRVRVGGTLDLEADDFIGSAKAVRGREGAEMVVLNDATYFFPAVFDPAVLKIGSY